MIDFTLYGIEAVSISFADHIVTCSLTLLISSEDAKARTHVKLVASSSTGRDVLMNLEKAIAQMKEPLPDDL